MNAERKAKASGTWRNREHLYTNLPFKNVLKMRMDELGIKNIDLQSALGYPAPNVIAMMKSGSMRLPENKVVDAARVLKLPPEFLLRKVLMENNPELWSVISTLMGKRLVTDNEMTLIEFVRKETDGHDLDLTETQEIVQVIKPILKSVVERVKAETAATLARIEEGKKPKA